MSNEITGTEDIIDSRDIIARIEELQNEKDEYQERDLTEPLTESWAQANPEEAKELKYLLEVAAECEGYCDWDYGEQLIRSTYFVTYTEELIWDCYAFPKEFESGEWPYRHITFDYEQAAEELQQDYACVEVNGYDFYIRCT